MEVALVALVVATGVAEGWKAEKTRGQAGEVRAAVVVVALDDLVARLGYMAPGSSPSGACALNLGRRQQRSHQSPPGVDV